MNTKSQTVEIDVVEENNKNLLVIRWDAILNDYDSYVTAYILHYKKSLKGNKLSSYKYPYLKTKSDDLSKKLNKGIDKKLLSTKQLLKINKIRIKIMYACCN